MAIIRTINERGCLTSLSIRRKILRTATLLSTIIILNISTLFAQGKLTGFVVDDELGLPLEKAAVTIPGTLISVLTDQQGMFYIDLKGGHYPIEVNFPGYESKNYSISVSDGITTPMFIIKLKSRSIGQALHLKTSLHEIKSKFPGTIENISAWDMQQLSANQEFNYEFRTIPSAVSLSKGGGFNDSNIGFRGKNYTRTAYTLDGILLNNPETGETSPAMLAGLSEWAGQIQVISGQAISQQNRIGTGGSINVASLLPYEKAGATVSAIYGNNNYIKTTATASTGQSRNGLSSLFQLSRSSSNGITQNTDFEQYGFFMNIRKEFNHFHSLSFSVYLSEQNSERKTPNTVNFHNRYGRKLNPDWGYYNDKAYSWNTNYGRSPLFSTTHYWHPRIKTWVVTQLYAQVNSSAQLFPLLKTNQAIQRDKYGQILFDRLAEWNKGENADYINKTRTPNNEGKFINTLNEGITVMAEINRETRVGLKSTITRKISNEVDISGALNVEAYWANHNNAVNNLFEADGFIDYSDYYRNNVHQVEKLFQSKSFPKFGTADKVEYHYLSEIQTGNLSTQINYHASSVNAYLGMSASLQNIARTDYFNYKTNDPNRKTKLYFTPGANVQGGLVFKIWKYQYISMKANYGSHQPMFATLFPSKNNIKNPGAKNEQTFDAELGYTLFSRKLKIEATAYWSTITNQCERNRITEIISELNSLHKGVELKTSYKPGRNTQIKINGSLGDWRYTNDGHDEFYYKDGNNSNVVNSWLNNMRIDNVPQFSIYSEAEFRMAHNFYFRINYYRADNIYVPYGRSSDELYSFREQYTQWKLPTHDLIGVNGDYLLDIRKIGQLNIIFSVNNIFDNKNIERIETNIPKTNNSYSDNKVLYGAGRTWLLGVKFRL